MECLLCSDLIDGFFQLLFFFFPFCYSVKGKGLKETQCSRVGQIGLHSGVKKLSRGMNANVTSTVFALGDFLFVRLDNVCSGWYPKIAVQFYW